MGFFRNIFGGGTSSESRADVRVGGPRISRRSTGFHEFSKAILRPEGQVVLDLGPTSPANIQFITGLGHRAYNEDIIAGAMDPKFLIPGEQPGTKSINVDEYLKENLEHERELFDAVMLWDVCDYLPEELVKPVIDRIYRITRPSGLLIGFFHTKDAGSSAPYCRYHVVGNDTLELQNGAPIKLQRVFNNRHIENLFHDFSSIKFFLGKENIREVLIVR